MKKPFTFKFERKDSEPKMYTFLIMLMLLPVISGCGLAFVNAPPTGWESSSDLETIALTQPCTNSKILVAVDGVLGAVYVAQGALYTQEDVWWEPNKNELAIGSFVLGAIDIASAVSGNRKVNDCRQFNAALVEQRRGNDTFSTIGADQNHQDPMTQWIESLEVSPLPKIPYKN